MRLSPDVIILLSLLLNDGILRIFVRRCVYFFLVLTSLYLRLTQVLLIKTKVATSYLLRSDRWRDDAMALLLVLFHYIITS
jgi:hypothetical protein